MSAARRPSTIGRRAGAVAIGLLVDGALGEPPAALHPALAARLRPRRPRWVICATQGTPYWCIVAEKVLR